MDPDTQRARRPEERDRSAAPPQPARAPPVHEGETVGWEERDPARDGPRGWGRDTDDRTWCPG